MNKNILIGIAVILGLGAITGGALFFFGSQKPSTAIEDQFIELPEQSPQEQVQTLPLGGLKAPVSQGTTTSSTSTINVTTTPKIKITKQIPKTATSTSPVVLKIEKKPLIFTPPPSAITKNALLPDQYIVILKKSPTQEKDRADILKKYGIASIYQYTSGRSGFAVKLDTKKRDALKNDPRIDTVTQDSYISIFETTSTAGLVTSTVATSSRTVVLPPKPAPLPVAGQQLVPNGIARILGQSSEYKGTGIGVAVLDTGVDLTHPDLKGRVVANVSCVKSSQTGNDEHGHGTHVAGIIAANDNTVGVVGIAPQARIIAVKVLDAKGIGTASSVLCGIDWIQGRAIQYNIKVANMGFGGIGQGDTTCGTTNHDPLHQALCQSTQAGMTYVAAAGNESTDTSSIIPATYGDTLITVSAFIDTDGFPSEKGNPTNFGNDDTFANFSNFGTSVAIGAPGVDIVSTGKKGTYYAAHGTSMAAAYVTGMLALYFQSHPGTTWRDAKTALQLAGEHQGTLHTDPSGNHPEAVLQVVVF